MTRYCFLIVMMITQPALAAQTGTVTITGQVPQACNIVVTGSAGASNISDISAGDTDRPIATVNESCNDPDGYTVTILGTHSGNHTGLFVDNISSDSHPFTVKYNGVNVASGGIVTDVTSPAYNVSKPVLISYAADPTLTPTSGFSYAETLTFTIAAK